MLFKLSTGLSQCVEKTDHHLMLNVNSEQKYPNLDTLALVETFNILAVMSLDGYMEL